MDGTLDRVVIGCATPLGRALLACLLCAVALGCAPKQKIALGCIPKEVTVYVDGEALEETPSVLKLRSDEPHTIFVKGEGYQPEMIVLESVETEGKHRLSPGEVCIQPHYVGVQRKLHVEVEDEELGEGADRTPPAAN